MVTSCKSIFSCLLCATILVSVAEARWFGRAGVGLCAIYDASWSCDAEEGFRESYPTAPRRTILLDEPEPEPDPCDLDLVGTTFALMEEGDEKIELTENEEAIFVSGNTGAGKTTLTYFVAGNNSALISYYVDRFNNLIKDCNGKIGDSTIISKTIFPDLVVEEKTNTAFYDNPGFQDTRTPCIEIANAYFITKVVNHLKRVKFVIAANHASLVPLADRGEFIRTLKNVLSFIPNLQKFLPNIALVGTKISSGGDDINYRVEQMSQFLTKNQPDLNVEFSGSALTMVNNLFDSLNESAADSTLDSPTYKRMHVFRMPEECGPLSDIEHMRENRANIMNIVMNNLKYTETSTSDFGLSLSSDVKLKIQEMSRELSKKVVESFTLFTTKLLEHFDPQFEFDCVTGCGLDLLISDLRLLFSNPDFAGDYSNGSEWEGLNFTEVINRVVDPKYLPVSFQLSSDLSESLKKYGRYLDFLASFDQLPIDKSDWFGPLKSLKSKVVEKIREASLQLARLARTSLTDLTPVLNTTNLADLQSLGVYDKREELTSYMSKIEGAVADLESSFENGPVKTYIFIQEVLDKFVELGLAPGVAQNYSDSLLPPFEVFDDMGSPSFVDGVDSAIWLSPFTPVQAQLIMEEKWNDFLINLWSDLSHIDYQSGNKGGLKTWWQNGGRNNNDITLSGFSDFWARFNGTPAVLGRTLKEFTQIVQTDTLVKLKNLNDLLSTSLGKSVNCVFSESGAVTTVTGNFVTFAAILSNTSCIKTDVTKTVRVFASHSIFIDHDFGGAAINGGNNVDLTIISPTLWYSGSINLDGTPGLLGDSSQGVGGSGGPGKPGGKAGNLISIGQTFPDKVKDSAKGGRGGNGAAGQKGVDKVKGETKRKFCSASSNSCKPSTDECVAKSGGGVRVNSYYRQYGYYCYSHMGDDWCHAGDQGTEFIIYGGQSTAGGDGGHGGKAGIGGKGGHLYTVKVNELKSDNLESDGSVGDLGKGGAAGRGGQRGDELWATIDDVPGLTEKVCAVYRQHHQESSEKAQDGKSGTDGGNSISPSQPKPQNFNSTSVLVYFSQFKSSVYGVETNQFLSNLLTEFKSKGDQILQQ